jgi:hypothetical protein
MKTNFSFQDENNQIHMTLSPENSQEEVLLRMFIRQKGNIQIISETNTRDNGMIAVRMRKIK